MLSVQPQFQKDPRMWPFITLVTCFATPTTFLRNVRYLLSSLPPPIARPWAERGPHPMPNFALPAALREDIWKHNREELDVDIWKEDRAKLGASREKLQPRRHPGRKEFLLERMDGGESLDMSEKERMIMLPRRKEGLVK